MQQADRAASIRAGDASPGKFDEISTQTVVLEIAQIDTIEPLADHGIRQLDRIRTLLRAADEVAEEASGLQGYWYRESGWQFRRFNQISSLLDLVGDEVERLDKLLHAGRPQ
ncbi:hypothetical protein SAQ01S_07710 [Sphingomonas aquatilis NBRC 16722]|uniref:Uncharacterized protein n=1 Tax=Sphingomonas aquatilis TaxID=93063 RepID=A0AAW3TRV3_9SPHN|nr:hypothetical protein [Sphingomonas aquatilis]MBB3875312.1 hypothetical protein [Sphingomonas aquatilis]GEM71005.1 hypothetical protein SAQ01S_07710 [Sphingomonas aquatilis NBRC 16722]